MIDRRALQFEADIQKLGTAIPYMENVIKKLTSEPRLSNESLLVIAKSIHDAISARENARSEHKNHIPTTPKLLGSQLNLHGVSNAKESSPSKHWEKNNVTEVRNYALQQRSKYSSCCSRDEYINQASLSWRGFTVFNYCDSHSESCKFNKLSMRTKTVGITCAISTYLKTACITATISISTGLGQLSISPQLRYSGVMAYNAPALKLLRLEALEKVLSEYNTIREKNMLPLFLENTLKDLYALFSERKASPVDVDEQGSTLLHVS